MKEELAEDIILELSWPENLANPGKGLDRKIKEI